MIWFKRLFNIDPQWRVIGYGPSKEYQYEAKHSLSARIYVVESQYGHREFKAEVLNISNGATRPDFTDCLKLVQIETTSFKRDKLNEWSVAKFNKVFGTKLTEYADGTPLYEFLYENKGSE